MPSVTEMVVCAMHEQMFYYVISITGIETLDE